MPPHRIYQQFQYFRLKTTRRSVGQVLTRLKDFRLDERTLVIFTSDNGAGTEAAPAACAE